MFSFCCLILTFNPLLKFYVRECRFWSKYILDCSFDCNWFRVECSICPVETLLSMVGIVWLIFLLNMRLAGEALVVECGELRYVNKNFCISEAISFFLNNCSSNGFH